MIGRWLIAIFFGWSEFIGNSCSAQAPKSLIPAYQAISTPGATKTMNRKRMISRKGAKGAK